MIKEFSVLAIIPARGGSKRIPNKNIKLLKGKPLIGYAIDEAKKSQYIDRVITSTDDQGVAQMAKDLGSEVPFMRPEELAQDHVTDLPVFQHTLKWLEDNESYCPDIVVQLRPTSPLRTVEHIDESIALLAENLQVDSVRTVTEPEQSPYKMYGLDEDGLLQPLLSVEGEKESFNLPGQKLPQAYKHVGYVDVMWHKTLMEKKQMTGSKILPLVLDEAYSGINTEKDWEYYEYLIERKRK